MSVKVLITGANFNNKGAQSMLFVAVDEIRKRIPNSEIYFGCGFGDPKLENVCFKQVCFSRESRYIALGGGQAIFNFFVAIAKACVHLVHGKRFNIWNFFDVKKNISSMNLIIDISGFALGDKWSKRTNENFLNIIRLAKRDNIPIFVMPQSFGPFQYKKELSYIRKEISELFKYPEVVFAREKEGYELLIQDFGLTNVKYSSDLVLQNTGINLKNIYRKMPVLSLPEFKTEYNVGIVPNARCFIHGNSDEILKHYKAIINELLGQGKEVYVFRHSVEDLAYCKKIADLFISESHVHLLENDFSCLEYDRFIKNFEFIICSRFHGIVHAYKNYVPVIALGWAVKYREIAKSVGQEAYIFDITDQACEEEVILQAVRDMIQNLDAQKDIIKDNVREIQSENCFECISEWVKKNYE